MNYDRDEMIKHMLTCNKNVCAEYNLSIVYNRTNTVYTDSELLNAVSKDLEDVIPHCILESLLGKYPS